MSFLNRYLVYWLIWSTLKYSGPHPTKTIFICPQVAGIPHICMYDISSKIHLLEGFNPSLDLLEQCRRYDRSWGQQQDFLSQSKEMAFSHTCMTTISTPPFNLATIFSHAFCVLIKVFHVNSLNTPFPQHYIIPKHSGDWLLEWCSHAVCIVEL